MLGNNFFSMCKTFSSILKRFALFPLVILAVTMVCASSYMRYLDAKATLHREKHVAAQFLNEPAAEAIRNNKAAHLKTIIAGAAAASDRFVCIAVRDNDHNVVASIGRCRSTWSSESTIKLYSTFNAPPGVDSKTLQQEKIGDLLVVMNSELFSAEIRRILIQLLIASTTILIIFILMNFILKKRLVQPFKQIIGVVNAMGRKDYSQRIVGFNNSDELGQLAASLNKTIEDIEEYTTQLRASRDEATVALIAADDAFLAKESLMQSLSQDLMEPAQELVSSLTYVAMANDDTALSNSIRGALKRAQDLSVTFNDFSDIVATDSSGTAAVPSSMSLTELATKLDAIFVNISDSINIELDYRGDALSASAIPDDVSITLDSQTIKRLLHHICRAIADQCISTTISVTAHVAVLERQRANIAFDFRATYLPELMNSSPTEEKRQLPSFFNSSARVLIQHLCRIHDADIVHMCSKSGSFILSASITTEFSNDLEYSPILEQQSAVRPKTVIISNDPQILKLSSRASLSKANIAFIRPDQCHRSTPELMEPLDCIAIDTGTGASDDFDHKRVIDLIKDVPAQKNVVFSAIVGDSVLSNAFTDRLISCGYSGILQRPITLARLREELCCLVSSARQASYPFGVLTKLEHA